jgi:hypothetical protein
MTAAEFRRLALALPCVVEASHMGHPDFRVDGKIFATLGHPDSGFGALMLSPLDQTLLLQSHPKAFAPAAGAWGRAGSTIVTLRLAPRTIVEAALEAAWKRRTATPARKRSRS